MSDQLDPSDDPERNGVNDETRLLHTATAELRHACRAAMKGNLGEAIIHAGNGLEWLTQLNGGTLPL